MRCSLFRWLRPGRRIVLPPEAMRLRPPTGLLASRRGMLVQLEQALGFAPAYQAQWVRPLLHHYADFVQTLPLAPHLPGLTALDDGLQRALTALTTGMSALGEPSDDPIQRYALLSAVLIRQAGAVATGQTITLFDRRGQRLGPWEPLAGPMRHVARATYGLTQFMPDPPGSLGNVLLYRQLVPEAALLELLDGDRLDPWLDRLIQLESTTALGPWLAQAEGALGLKPEPGGSPPVIAEPVPLATILPLSSPAIPSPSPKVADADPHDPGWAFILWLREQLITGMLTVNKPRALVHVATEGVVLLTPGMFKAHSGVDWQRTQRRFLKLRQHQKKSEGGDFFTYRLGQGEPFKAILLPEASLLFAEAVPPPNPHLYRVE